MDAAPAANIHHSETSYNHLASSCKIYQAKTHTGVVKAHQAWKKTGTNLPPPSVPSQHSEVTGLLPLLDKPNHTSSEVGIGIRRGLQVILVKGDLNRQGTKSTGTFESGYR